jgi:hypothetical protein
MNEKRMEVLGDDVMVEFGLPYVPPPGEHDLLIEGLDLVQSQFGVSARVKFVMLSGEDRGETFAVWYPVRGRITPRTRLGQLLAQLGLPVEELARSKEKRSLKELLAGKRIRAILVTEESKSGIEFARIAQVVKVYAEGEGPTAEGLPTF